MNDFFYKNDFFIKVCIVVLTIIICTVILGYLWENWDNLSVGKANTPPEIGFLGRSKAETLAIHAFSQYLYKNGYNWNEIIVGYRPSWLKNDITGKSMEIDAYHPISKIGIEYNGIQHYKYPNHCHKTEQEFIDYQRRDIIKKRICNNYKIKIIVIPYTVDTCEIKNLKYINRKYSDKERIEKILKYIEDHI